MQLTSLALFLGAAISTVTAYPIKSSNVNCRSGPGTQYKVVKVYAQGTDVKLSCQAYGESINGDTLWDKTQDGCYVSDWYVKTGTSNPVTTICGASSGSGDKSSYNGKITRAEIIARGEYWITRHVPYSMDKTYPDPEGRAYRTDCSGFVSMALHTDSPGYNTVSLPDVVKAIAWADLKPGDVVGTLGAGTGGSNGHVTLFHSWVDASTKKEYNTLECRGTAYGCIAYKRPVGWTDGSYTAKPYRYIRVTD